MRDKLIALLQSVVDKLNKLDMHDIPQPYVHRFTVTEKRAWNRDYPQDTICICGHPYYRHFDSYDHMTDVGCKYCECYTFINRENTP